jgi:hypothetical protein
LPRKEPVDLRPNNFSSGEASPMHANQTHKLETDIDWRQKVFALGPHAVYKKRFDVWLHMRQNDVFID